MSALDPLAYLNNKPKKYPMFITADRAPTSNDLQDAGTRWLDQSASPVLIYESKGNGDWDVGGVDLATTTNPGIVELATDVEAIAKSATDKALLPSNLAAIGATDTFAGLIEIATDAEAIAKTETDKSLVPSNLAAIGATDTFAGLIEIATDAEAQARTETDKALVPSNLAAEGFPQVAEVTLTAVQVKALAATPIQLVPAPAAGNVLVFMGAELKLTYGGTNAFTEAGDNLAVKFTDGSGAQVSQTIETTGFIDQTADTYTNAEPKIDVIVAAAAAEAQALVLHNLNAEIAGNAANDNTLTVNVMYRVVSL